MDDAAENLAHMVAETKYQDLPVEAIQACKMDILDTLATLIAGSSAAGIQEIVRTIRHICGTGNSTILLHSIKTSPNWAALANATMAHALDYDDTHDEAVLHAGVTVIPAALAVAEGRNVSGQEFITAVILGVDVACRLGLAIKKPPTESGWMLTSLCGYFGAAATVGKILKLDEEELTNAFGIAYAQTAGNTQCVVDGSLTKRVQAGFAASGGVVAALLSQGRITGSKHSLEGEFGFYSVYHDGQYDPVRLTEQLGQHFEIVNLSFKPYPCCRYTHGYIDAALQLANENDIDPQAVKSIEVIVGQLPNPLCDPLDVKCQPRTIVDAQFSIPYTVALALIKRDVKIADFTEESIKDPKIIQLAHKVTPTSDTAFAGRHIMPAIVKIELDGGTRFEAEVQYPKGHPKNPLTIEDIGNKLRDGIDFAIKTISSEEVDDVTRTVKHLEYIPNIDTIVKLLS
jgi:2-methylcitrate dehydratase PrpD